MVVSVVLSCCSACLRRYLSYALLLLFQKHIQSSLVILDCNSIIRRDSSPAEMSSSSQSPPGGDQSQTEALMGMTIAMLSCSTIFVSLRFHVRIFIVKSVWWDDWTILFALVRFMRFLCFDAEFKLVRHGSGRRIGLYRFPLWLRSPSILHRWPSLWQIHILFIRRVDPEFCDLDVDEDIHLLLFKPNSSNKGLAEANVHCCYSALYFQLDSHPFMDLKMYSCEGDLGLDNFREVFHEEPTTGDNLSSRQ